MARDLLEDSSSDGEENAVDYKNELQINQEFAQRFEHNKKREELQKLEEQYGKPSRKRKRDDGQSDSSSEESSSSEEEDDAGELATVALDNEIMATLSAIRSQDPRVYDGTTTFYSSTDQNEVPVLPAHKEKPMYLRDYHRQNLLDGTSFKENEKLSYSQEQETLKQEVIKAMHGGAVSESESEGDLLVVKRHEKPAQQQVVLDVENADKDPEAFLSNFMASRSWVPNEKSQYQAFESDDDEDERRAEEFEEAYNFRFEDPARANDKLRTHARDMAAKQSVRREEKNARRKKREGEKENKLVEKQRHQEGKARLKKLRVDELAQKVKKIKRAAGLRTADFQPEDWARLVDDEWDDAKWEEEMQQRFGEDYYAAQEPASDGEKKSHGRPKFDDDIDITDLVPDFRENEERYISLSEDEPHIKREGKPRKGEKQKETRKERRLLEQLVDDQLQFELVDTVANGTGKTAFRYRETSPQSFGMTSLDILLADDSHLNQFAGLKKLASFRDPEKKIKDKKHLGKKARLRKWRQETFGTSEGISIDDLKPAVSSLTHKNESEADEVNVSLPARKKKRRSKKPRNAQSVQS